MIATHDAKSHPECHARRTKHGRIEILAAEPSRLIRVMIALLATLLLVALAWSFSAKWA